MGTLARHFKFSPPSCLGCPRGFSLLEMLIATFIMAVSILALTSLTITGMRMNLGNDLRNAAVRLTSEEAETVLADPIDTPVQPKSDRNVMIRGANRPFTITRDVVPLSNDLREVRIVVSYTYRGQPLSNSIVVYKHRAN